MKLQISILLDSSYILATIIVPKAATQAGYKKEFLEKTGLVIAYDNGNLVIMQC